jgi:hypothetical protein
MKKWLKIFGIGVVLTFAGIGFFLTTGFVAVNLGLTNDGGVPDNRLITVDLTKKPVTSTNKTYIWNTGPEWEALEGAIIKDQLLIEQVSRQTGVPTRLLVTPLVVEQLRLFHSEREIFKSYFGPLKILGNQTMFSWGIFGFKDYTAKQVEENLKNKDSSFYLGPRYEHLLDFETADHDAERFDRLTNSKDYYYSYLYGALYMKELMTQWQKAGFNITDRPEIVATLFNIGFDKSIPKNNPQIGGAEIDIGDTKVSFGELAGWFYYSEEMIDIFPR